MEGVPDDPGIITRAFRQIFEAIDASTGAAGRVFLVSVTFLEIYNDSVRDLWAVGASKKVSEAAGLKLKEAKGGGVEVDGITSKELCQKASLAERLREVAGLYAVGQRSRSTAATKMNATSSRSHAVLTISIESRSTAAPAPGGTGPPLAGKDAGGGVRKAKLNLVDLAGSERQSKTGATGDRLAEASEINGSLFVLGKVGRPASERIICV